VQVRLATALASEDYISRRGWEQASISHCPLHRRGGCGLRRCGSYERKQPLGLRIFRWYCPKARCTFSLIPDFAASHLGGTLLELEGAVMHFDAERERGSSVALAARAVRPDIEPESALRWINRRRRWVDVAVALLTGVCPELSACGVHDLRTLRVALGVDCVLVHARHLAAAQLPHAPSPLGFAGLPGPGARRKIRRAQSMGADRSLKPP
jgi:hypothetical protein